MDKEDIYWHESGKRFHRDTGEKHVFKLRTYPAYVLDMEDIHFHFDSAVLLPDYGPFENLRKEDERVTGLAVLRTCLRWAEENPSHKLLIAGHTDRSGSENYNLGLSRLRARNVFYMLTGDRDKWVAVCREKHQVEDYQLILKWISSIWGWDCDPGPVNNTQNPETKAATERFQAKYKEQEWGEDIGVDGKVGKETWGAFFRVYERVLMFIAEVDEEGLKALRDGLVFVRDDRKWVGCGEYHPITPERTVQTPEEKRAYERSVTDRRVELMFFRPDHPWPPLDCHPSETKCKPEICWVYNPMVFRYIPIIPEPIPPLVETWVLRILEAGTGKIDERAPVKKAAYQVTGSGGPTDPVKGTTDDNGVLRVRVYGDPTTMKLEIRGVRITLDAGTLKEIDEGDDASYDRLYNLGHGGKKPADWTAADRLAATKRFQEVHGVGDGNGTLDGPTKDRLKELYGS